MKFIFIFAVFSFTSSVFAASEYAMILGEKNPSILWLKQEEINDKKIHLVGFRSSENIELQQVFPKEEYTKILKEMQDWQRSLSKSPLTGILCTERVTFIKQKERKELCLDATPEEEKQKLLTWMRRQSHKILGRF